MKKNLISLAVAASVLGGSAAIAADQHVNSEKTGEVLLFPFYNADNGNATNMHIVNTTDKVKAVKIRFVEHKNSTEVLDFNLYLSKHDHFAFGVIKDPNGNGAAVITADNSCTVPALGSANGAFSGTATTNADGSTVRVQPFVNYQYANLLDVDTSIERTLTGHVEVIEMGVVGVTTDTVKGQYATYATHGATGVPVSCAALNAAWASGAWKTNGGAGVTAPTGGLYGLAYHINVEAAAAFGFEPTAIEDFNDSGAAVHTNPGTLLPSITSGSKTGSVYHGAGGDQHVAIAMGSGIETTSAILQTASIANDVMLNAAIGGMTDWVLSFPTKKTHVDKASVTAVIAPFTDNYDGNAVKGTAKVEKLACEPVGIEQWDREEGFTASTTYFSPTPDVATTSICNEVAVIAMGAAGTASALSVSTGLTNLGFPYAEGWQRFTFGQTNATSTKVQRSTLTSPTGYIDGLPVIGFAAYKVNNGAMSYGNASEFKTSTVSSGLGSS